MTDPLLTLEGVTRAFPSPDGGPPLTVVQPLDMTVRSGDSLAIVGPSGSGKSTLLNLIGGLDRPTAGRVVLEGRDLAGLDDDALSAVRNTRIGFVFQSHHLLPQCTVWENVLLPTLAGHAKTDATTLEARARELIERVGLTARTTHRPGQLSGGECLRVAIARALINTPALLLADEPTGSLDAATSEQIAQLLIDLNTTEGLTLIVVTHSTALAGRMKRQLTLGVATP